MCVVKTKGHLHRSTKTMLDFRAHLQVLRLPEILLMTGFSFVGILFVPTVTVSVIPLVGFFVFFYVFAVYALNSVMGYKGDQGSERLGNVSLISKKVYTITFVGCVFLFMIISFMINELVMWISLCSLAVWISYYVPPLQLKSSFFGGTVAHFLGGILHFHMGYACFADPTVQSVMISGIFALLLGIGHVNHEIIDANADLKAGLRTTAVRMGLKWSTNLRTILSGGLVFYILLLAGLDVLSFRNTAIFLPSTVLIFATSAIQTDRPFIFQKVSRISIAASCLILLVERLATWVWI